MRNLNANCKSRKISFSIRSLLFSCQQQSKFVLGKPGEHRFRLKGSWNYKIFDKNSWGKKKISEAVFWCQPAALSCGNINSKRQAFTFRVNKQSNSYVYMCIFFPNQIKINLIIDSNFINLTLNKSDLIMMCACTHQAFNQIQSLRRVHGCLILRKLHLCVINKGCCRHTPPSQ